LGGWVPRIETYRKDNDYVVRVDLPGVDPKDVEIRAEGNVLSISGERKTEQKGQTIKKQFTGNSSAV
jgi:HSP20 family protein